MKHPAPAASAKPATAPPVPRHPPDVERLVKAIRGPKPPDFRDLCDTLGLSPTRTEEVIQKALALGVHVHVEHNHVGIRANYGTFANRVQHLHLPPLAGDEVKVAVISDTHFGSEHCLRDAIKNFIHTAYAEGVRIVLHPGDMLDGMYRHDAPGSQRYVGIDGQARDALDTLPELPGLIYIGITGNHDETFTKASGSSVGHFLENFFKGAGRYDLRFLGDRGASLVLHGTRIDLWHPLKGKGYADSYPLQRHISAMEPVRRPHILLTGHWHTFCYILDQGVHAFACPTFQGGGGSYGKAIGGAPDIGGLILRWRMSEDGTLRDLGLRYHVVHEEHMVHDVEGAR